METSPPSRGPAELPIFRAEQPRKGPLLQSPTHFSRRKVLQSAKLLRLPSMSVNFTPGESQRRVLRDDQVSSNIPLRFLAKQYGQTVARSLYDSVEVADHWNDHLLQPRPSYENTRLPLSVFRFMRLSFVLDVCIET